jgi:hypothetical protein
MESNLETTNLLLGVMAVVSVLEALLIVALAVAGFIAYRRLTALVSRLEERQVAPAMARVSAILDDVKSVSARVKDETERVDQALHSTLHRVDDTLDRVRSNVRSRASRLVGIVRGARVALEAMLQSRAT